MGKAILIFIVLFALTSCETKEPLVKSDILLGTNHAVVSESTNSCVDSDPTINIYSTYDEYEEVKGDNNYLSEDYFDESYYIYISNISLDNSGGFGYINTLKIDNTIYVFYEDSGRILMRSCSEIRIGLSKEDVDLDVDVIKPTELETYFTYIHYDSLKTLSFYIFEDQTCLILFNSEDTFDYTYATFERVDDATIYENLDFTNLNISQEEIVINKATIKFDNETYTRIYD